MDIQLRDYQKKFISDIQAQFENGVNSVVGVAPCGAGKTVMAAAIVKSAIERGENVLFFVHRKELIDQTAKTFCRFGIPFGVISAGNKPNYDLPVQIASVQTLVNRLNNIHKPDLLICDECHHILADSYIKIIKKLPNAKLLGITATPERMGGVRLGDIFDSMVLAPNVSDLIKKGNLTDFEYFASDLNLDLKNIHTARGDYVNDELSKLMNQKKILVKIVENYSRFADGKSALCYCVNIEHSKQVAERFNECGIPAAQVDGTTDKFLRQKMVDDFRRGDIKVLCNAELFGEGFDVPNMDAVILARPTQSLTLFIQQAMRPLRPDPNNPDKIATIIDCVDNISRFGLPDDNRNWSLNPNEEEEKQPPKFKICPKCFSVSHISSKTCSKCGHIYETVSVPKELSEGNHNMIKIPKGFERYIIVARKRGYRDNWAVFQFLQDDNKHSFGDFQEIENYMGYKRGWAINKFLDTCPTLAELEKVAKIMGYKKGWAWHKYNENNQKK